MRSTTKVVALAFTDTVEGLVRGANQGKVRREDMLAICQERRHNDFKPHGAFWVPWMDPDDPYFHHTTPNLA